ncbi:protocadherin-like wing polarity protein stan isoform X2 [Centruroides vittatus]|uniref:protocadherin-like wing polarity protein stan isoform X2 n=1 Tax=Centruroides vittatus TaxID=120091 RepID=UPI00350F9F9E
MRNWPPSFDKDLYVVRVPEENAIGYRVITLNATDPERGRVTFSIHATVDSRSQTMFEVDLFSGEVKTTTVLDREYMDIHYLKIKAVDDGIPPATATTMLKVYVEDVNDHVPVFEQDVYYPKIKESSPIWTTVLTVRATDQDSGSNSEVEYSLKDDTSPFRIDPYGGDITIARKLDRETISEYQIEVIATDSAEDITRRRTGEAQVIVTVEDDNDNYPQFSESSYNATIREDVDSKLSPDILQIRAVDADEGVNAEIRYAIIGGNTQSHFYLNPSNGILTVSSQLDYESVRSYKLLVRAQDNGSPPRSNTTQITINVIDVNDNSPQFYADIIEESLAENVPIGHKVILVQAYDPDDGKNGNIEYSIQRKDPLMPIAIQPSSGWIITSGIIDREITSVYHFTVVATDQGVPPRFSTCNVTIRIQDVNDNDPVFNPKLYEVSISELEPPGSHVVTVIAHDEDADQRLTYHISRGNTRDRFSITSRENGGIINIAQPLDFDLERNFALTVTATDIGGRSDTATVYINITDANTHRPIFEGSPYSSSVSEDAPSGTTVLIVEAWDGDEGENARVTYTMDHVPEFSIDSLTGAIITTRKLDRELVPAYSLVVTARDHGMPSLTDTTNVEIEVLDINDNPPIFTVPRYVTSISEDVLVGTSVVQVSAPDPDIGLNGQVRYHLNSDPESTFSIDPTAGVIRTEKLLDRESVAMYQLVVRAMDRGSPPLSSTVSVTIQVQDVNDNPPSFNTDRITLFVSENTIQGSVVGEIEATDPDEGANAVIYYRIVDGPDGHLFHLLPHPGKSADLICKTDFDYESPKKRYSLVIRASSPPLRQDVDVDIWVTDVNDNAPVLNDFLIVANVYGSYLPRESLGRIPAFDPDVGDELQYRLLSGNSKYLDVEEGTGIIHFHPNLNFQDRTKLDAKFEIGVFDGVNEVTATCRLYIRQISDQMLKNSVTLRLKEVNEKIFLSSVYELFIEGIASTVPCSKENVVVFNIKDDTEVKNRILNVTFAVKARDKEYHERKKLESIIYLRRNFLSQLFRKEVLPFEDDLCVHEPCISYEECHSVTKYGNSSKFISSETIIFRSIHPVNTYSCKCPPGFTGMNHKYECDTEVNLCYSSPCENGGRCQQKENGFTCVCENGYVGERCETNVFKGRCSPNVCHGDSYCLNRKDGGFECLNCTYDELWRTPLCQLKSRSFLKDSYLMFPSLNRRHRFHIKLKFATRETNGLLIYNGRYNEEHDFVALEIINSQIWFSFSVGSNVSKVNVDIPHGISDGLWHEVELIYLNRTITLIVDNCDKALSLQFGKMLGNYDCANFTTFNLEERCVDTMQTCYRFLDLTGPFLIGGLPSSLNCLHNIERHFVGCISDVYIDHKLLDLDGFISANGTETGCKKKENFCKSDPCHNGGICEDGWDSFICHCKPGFIGKDCGKVENVIKQFSGKGFLVYIPRLHPIQLPWSVGLSFRSRKKNGLLLQIQLGANSQVKLEITKSILRYSFNNESMEIDSIKVNDGKWHNVDAIWTAKYIELNLDYDQFKMQKEFKGNVKSLYVGKISIGGLEMLDRKQTTINFDGCIKDVRVGSITDSLIHPVIENNIVEGCYAPDVCNPNPCPLNSYCVDLWNNYTCKCKPGYIGEKCQSVCSLNPCLNGGTCIFMSNKDNVGYRCSCNAAYSGKYCEILLNHTCPSMWWGSPICGPCNCNTAKGYDANCNKTTGECVCEENHYKPENSDICIPCNCYMTGSYNNRCNYQTGQCHCRPGVIGKHCDLCSSPFAEVTLRGCEVIYNGCPKSFSNNIWWNRTPFDQTTVQPCPNGAIGNVMRHCSLRRGWEESNIFKCTSKLLLPLRKILSNIEDRKIILNSSVIGDIIEKMTIIHELQNVLFGNDIFIIFQLLHYIINYELQVEKQNLLFYHDNDFIHSIVLTSGSILSLHYLSQWKQISELTGRGPEYLLNLLEKYLMVISKPDDENVISPFEIVTDNLILGIDTVETMVYLSQFQKNDSHHLSSLPFLDFTLSSRAPSIILPKYNNYPNQKKITGDTTKVFIPLKLIESKIPKAKQKYIKSCHLLKNCAIVSYIIYPTIGKLLPSFYDNSMRKFDGKIIEINSDVFTLILPTVNNSVHKSLSENIQFQFQMLHPNHHGDIRCVYWKNNEGERGVWSSDGCTVVGKMYDGLQSFVNCSCNHLSSFGLLMDILPQTKLVMESGSQGAFSYFGILLSLIMLLTTLTVFCLLQGNETNSNTIHKNLVSSIFVADLIFLIALKTQGNHSYQGFTCKMMAILLHYFFLSEFCWIFVESLHLYRMLTEMQYINNGQMRIYYFIGYGVPSIIVGLAVGLHADQYGNDIFCWLSVHDNVVWSLVAPICILIVLVLGMFGYSVHSTVDVKETITDFGNVRTILWVGIVLLPILGATWILAVLCVNESVSALHYTFILFCLIEGIYVFFGYCIINKKVRLYLQTVVSQIINNVNSLPPINRVKNTRSVYRAPFKVLHRSVGISTCSSTSQSTAKTFSTPCRSESQYHPNIVSVPPTYGSALDVLTNPRSISEFSHSSSEQKKYAENEEKLEKIVSDESASSYSYHSSQETVHANGTSEENDKTPTSNSNSDITEFKVPPLRLPSCLFDQIKQPLPPLEFNKKPDNTLNKCNIYEEEKEQEFYNTSNKQDVINKSNITSKPACNDKVDNAINIHHLGSLLEDRFSPPLIDDSDNSESEISDLSDKSNSLNNKLIYSDYQSVNRTCPYQLVPPELCTDSKTDLPKKPLESTRPLNLIPPLATAELSSSDSE